MMRILALSIAVIGLAGCTSLSALTGGPEPASHAEVLRALGEHMEMCDRHYQGNLGLGASFTFNIDCKGRAAPQP